MIFPAISLVVTLLMACFGLWVFLGLGGLLLALRGILRSSERIESARAEVIDLSSPLRTACPDEDKPEASRKGEP